jgi:hypothetical protein
VLDSLWWWVQRCREEYGSKEVESIKDIHAAVVGREVEGG